MGFDPVSWAIGYAASQSVSTLLKRVFHTGAYEAIQAAAASWSAALPVEIRIPSAAIFDASSLTAAMPGPARSKLKRLIVDLHNIPSESDWFDALVEEWELKREELGNDANEFFLLRKEQAEEHLRRLANGLFSACASVPQLSQPQLIREMREFARTQVEILQIVKSFVSPLNDPAKDGGEAIVLDFDPLHIEVAQLHLLNEVVCVDSPAEVIAGRFRTHEIWVGPQGCSKEEAIYVPMRPAYIEVRLNSLLTRWNKHATDLGKQDIRTVIHAMGWFHHEFLQIHPYPDGNGRIARAILDLHIRNFTSSQLPLRLKSRNDYYFALTAADDGDLTHLVGLIIAILKNDLGEWD